MFTTKRLVMVFLAEVNGEAFQTGVFDIVLERAAK